MSTSVDQRETLKPVERQKKLSERLEWVIAHRQRTHDGRPMNSNSWAESAGLARTIVSGKLRAKPGEREGMDAETAERLAGAAQVSLGWLVSGRGSPDDPDVPPPPPPKPSKRPRARSSWAGWQSAAELLLALDTGLEWAIIGAGEQETSEAPPRRITRGVVLVCAENFDEECRDEDVRERLKLRADALKERPVGRRIPSVAKLRRASSPPKK